MATVRCHSEFVEAQKGNRMLFPYADIRNMRIIIVYSFESRVHLTSAKANATFLFLSARNKKSWPMIMCKVEYF